MTTRTQTTHLIQTHEPTLAEFIEHGGEVVFVRGTGDGKTVKVFAARCYDSWSQWGADTQILYDNIDAVTKWRRNLTDFNTSFHGSFVIVTPLTRPAREWLNENIQSDAQWFAGGVAVEPRYLNDILAGIAEDELIVG